MSAQPTALTEKQIEKLTANHKAAVPLAQLPAPWAEERVKAVDSDTIVLLWRGTTLSRVAKMLQMKSMSGEVQPDPNTTPPDEDAVKSQVGTNTPGVARTKLPECTTNKNKAVSYGTGGVVILVYVKKKYLAKASESEGGWATRNDAPFEALAWVPGPQSVGNVKRWNVNAD